MNSADGTTLIVVLDGFCGMDYQLSGDAALVAASSSGLGKGAAKALAAEGVDVVVNGRDEDKLDRAVAEIREVATGAVVGQAADITDTDECEALVDLAVDELGRLDHLVTSAGGPPRGTFFELTDDQWYESFDLLVMSVVRLVRLIHEVLYHERGINALHCSERVNVRTNENSGASFVSIRPSRRPRPAPGGRRSESRPG